MRKSAFALAVLFVSAPFLSAQTPSAAPPELAFSAPPAQVPDVTGWAQRSKQVTVVIKNAGSSAYNQAAERHKLCAVGELPCALTLRYEFWFKATCVTDAGTEEECQAGKSYPTLVQRLAARYILERNGVRAEGYAVASPSESSYRYFVRGSDGTWQELSKTLAPSAYTVEDDFFVNLYQAAAHIAEAEAAGKLKPDKPAPKGPTET